MGRTEFVVRHTPGHSPGSVSFVGAGMVFAGDVLFSGSIGRTDLPGGDFSTLMRSIHTQLLSLARRHGAATAVTAPTPPSASSAPPIRSSPAKSAPDDRAPGVRMTSGALVEQRIFSSAASTPIDIAGSPLPPPLRPDSSLGVLDITEFFGDTTGGVRTYLPRRRGTCRGGRTSARCSLIPGARDEILEAAGVRCYRLRGPAIPFNPAYRFMLATRSTSRIVAHERPDLIEVGSA